ncbi:hypothetical protein SNE26_28225 [Mucilaginibacter sp. cycad4]|uniref:hypothetical protein n=1 Tax=Mucilaginibacter sp. cycad4 TaxID=3342096 RepID=UPI002AABBB07|nr:hypothetical protein [Mucilaginibacter gossypii]WPU99900.1 hypothetical protein SNE26_28225 [Mucilaginibacter gossypii]
MKKTFFLFSTFIVISLTTKAQTDPTIKTSPKVNAERTLETLQRRLSLTDKQKTGLYLILLEQNNKIDSLKNIQAPRVIIKEQVKSSYQKIAGLLTPDQLKEYDNWMTEIRSKASH